MKLKRLGTLLLTAIIAATTLAGCGAMPSTGNGNETGENASVIAATEEDTDGQITLRVVDWSDGSATQREEFHQIKQDLVAYVKTALKQNLLHTLILKLNILCLQ